LVFGLPETAEGYIGIIIVTEYLKKYPHAFPIKSKFADEIFGPSNLMLSDMGLEFNNEIVQKLCQRCQIKHETTAAYNPRTNGLTERFNQTLCDSLRKHAEMNPLDWVKWLPYVLMCYRRRIHSVTGYSPFQLMFGRPMNNFSGWRVQKMNMLPCSTDLKNFVLSSIFLNQLRFKQ
jgi:transposase InsO family protein